MLSGCGPDADSTHPCSLTVPIRRALCFALDPLNTANYLSPHSIQLHADYHRSLVETLLDPPTLPLDPSTLPRDPSTVKLDPLTVKLNPTILAREELQECTLEEHTIAAQVISSEERGLRALTAVHTALRRQRTGSSRCGFVLGGFDPLKEYKNMATLGTSHTMSLDQQNLMTASEHLDMAGETISVLHFKSEIPPKKLNYQRL